MDFRGGHAILPAYLDVAHTIDQTVTNIGDALCLSGKTISTYRSRILEKMGFERNSELTAYALRHQLIS